MVKEIQATASKLPGVMSTKMPVPEGVFPRASRLIRLLILVSIISEGISETPSLTCPRLQTSSVGKANCSIDTTKFNQSGCFPFVLKFEFSNISETASTLCQTLYNTCGQELDNETICSCSKSDAGLNTFQLNIPGNERYKGGMLKCTVECLSGSSHSVMCGPLLSDPVTAKTLGRYGEGCARDLTTTEKLLMGLFIPVGVATIAFAAYGVTGISQGRVLVKNGKSGSEDTSRASGRTSMAVSAGVSKAGALTSEDTIAVSGSTCV